MTKYIYLAASFVNFIAALVSLFKGDILLSNTNLILAILFLNWYNNKIEIKIDSNNLKIDINTRQER